LTLSPSERADVAHWVRIVSTMSGPPQIDANILPVLQRLLEEETEVAHDPYADRRTVVSGKDVIGGRDDRGVTRKSERNQP